MDRPDVAAAGNAFGGGGRVTATTAGASRVGSGVRGDQRAVVQGIQGDFQRRAQTIGESRRFGRASLNRAGEPPADRGQALEPQ